MQTLLQTGNAVLISFAEAILRDAGIQVFVADQHIALTEGSIGAFPRRVMVAADDFDKARELLIAAGLGDELADDTGGAP